jgi:hypothetical protein
LTAFFAVVAWRGTTPLSRRRSMSPISEATVNVTIRDPRLAPPVSQNDRTPLVLGRQRRRPLTLLENAAQDLP